MAVTARPHHGAVTEKPARRRIEEIFGAQPWSKPDTDLDSGEERRRERELLENRPPHHDERTEDR